NNIVAVSAYYPKTVPASAVFASIDGMIEIFTLSFGYKPNLIAKSTLDRMYKIVIISFSIGFKSCFSNGNCINGRSRKLRF
ncbi:hypothetical protein O6R16_02125, partial [Candidatus Rickettsia tasmanensis]